MLKRIFVIGLAMLINQNIYANDLACSPAKVKVKQRLYILNYQNKSSVGKLFLINNKSDQVILLDHPQGKDPHAGAGWSTNLQPGNWSALVVAKPNFAINCSILVGDKVTNLDCGKVIKICEANQKIMSKDNASYWMVEDKPWSEFIKDVKSKL